MTQKNPICVALDTADAQRARRLVRALRGKIGLVKLGLEFFYACGSEGYRAVADEGVPIFLDLKLHDIPNTVAQGLRSLMALSPAPAIVNVHASGGRDMMKAAREAVGAETKLVAVTILTSLSNENIWEAGFARDRRTDDHAVALARLTHAAGLAGVVCSPLDLEKIRQNLPASFLTIVPGIRPADTASHDQKRIATPAAAMAAGADILVIGRAITASHDPAGAAQKILEGLPESLPA